MPLVYKFVELSTVTDDSLDGCVNEWVGKGWELDAIRFVVTEHSRRPGMAFVSFVRRGEPTEGDQAAAEELSPTAG